MKMLEILHGVMTELFKNAGLQLLLPCLTKCQET